MGLAKIPSNIEKIKRSEHLIFVDTTPNSTRNYVVVGIGTTEGTTEYNPDVEREKWIIEDNARTVNNGMDKQLSLDKQCYKNDPEFAYLDTGRDKLELPTHILEVDTWNATGNGYVAKESDGKIVINSYNGATISYTLYFDGDVVDGTCTIADGVPTFQATVSL